MRREVSGKSLAWALAVALLAAWSVGAWHHGMPPPPPPIDPPPDIDESDDPDEPDPDPGSFERLQGFDVFACFVLPRNKADANSKNELECKESKEGKPAPAAGPAEDTLPSGYSMNNPGPPPGGGGGGFNLHAEGSSPAQAAVPVYAVLDRISKDRVAFFNFETGALVASIDLAQGLAFGLTAPQRIAATLDGRTIAVTNLGDGFQGVTNPPHITVIDAQRRAIAGRVTLPAGERVQPIEIAPDLRTAYVGAWDETAVSPFAANPRILVVDLQTRTVTARIPLPVAVAAYVPSQLQLTPDGALLFIGGESVFGQGGRIHVVDTATRSVAATVRAEQTGTFFTSPPSLAMDPDGSTLWAGLVRRIVGGVAVWGVGGLDTATLEWRQFVNLRRIRASASDVLRASPDGDALYLNERDGRRVSRISIPNGRLKWEAATDQRNRGEFFFLYR